MNLQRAIRAISALFLIFSFGVVSNAQRDRDRGRDRDEHTLHNAPPKAWITSNVPRSSTTDPVSPTSTLLTPRVVPRWRVSP